MLNKSFELYNKTKQYITSGVNSGSRFREPHPIYYKRGKGAYLYDVDGNEYIDMIMGNGAIFFGRDYKPFRDRFSEIKDEYCDLITGVESELGYLTGKKFLETIPADRVRFTNTGTEAIMHVMQIARAYTGRNDFALVEGSYNGWVDNINISTFPSLNDVGNAQVPNSVPGMGGLDKKAVEQAVVVPFNDLESTIGILEKNREKLAAFILEPVLIDVGFIEPDIDYIKGIKEACDRLDILLVFDELLTGFRMPEGSCQKLYQVVPDLSIFGKAIANGEIIAAVTGTEEVMNTAATGGQASFVGTFNGHQNSLAACLAALELMEDGSLLKALDENTLYLRDQFGKIADTYNVPAQMLGRGGHCHFYFTDRKINNYRDAAAADASLYKRFAQRMNEQGIMVIGRPLSHHALTVSHDKEVLEKIVQAFSVALSDL